MTEASRPAHIGQPLALLVRLLTIAGNSWSGASSHPHQKVLFEKALTSCGVVEPFLRGCHWAATSGNRSANDSPGFGTAEGMPQVSRFHVTAPSSTGSLYRQLPASGQPADASPTMAWPSGNDLRQPTLATRMAASAPRPQEADATVTSVSAGHRGGADGIRTHDPLLAEQAQGSKRA